MRFSSSVEGGLSRRCSWSEGSPAGSDRSPWVCSREASAPRAPPAPGDLLGGNSGSWIALPKPWRLQDCLSAFLPLLLGCSGPFWGSGTQGVSLLFAPLPLGAGHREAGTALALLAPDGAWEALAPFPCAGGGGGGCHPKPQLMQDG